MQINFTGNHYELLEPVRDENWTVTRSQRRRQEYQNRIQPPPTRTTTNTPTRPPRRTASTNNTSTRTQTTNEDEVWVGRHVLTFFDDNSGPNHSDFATGQITAQNEHDWTVIYREHQTDELHTRNLTRNEILNSILPRRQSANTLKGKTEAYNRLKEWYHTLREKLQSGDYTKASEGITNKVSGQEVDDDTKEFLRVFFRLGRRVRGGVTPENIQKAMKKAHNFYHPDKVRQDRAEVKFMCTRLLQALSHLESSYCARGTVTDAPSLDEVPEYGSTEFRYQAGCDDDPLSQPTRRTRNENPPSPFTELITSPRPLSRPRLGTTQRATTAPPKETRA